MVAIVVFLLEMGFLALLNAGNLTEHSDFLISLLIFVFSFAYIASVSQDKKLRASKNPLIVGYFWRIALLYFDIYGNNIFILPNSGGDSKAFLHMSFSVARRGIRGSGFSGFMGSFFRTFGISQLLGQFWIVLFSVVALVYTAKILSLLEVDVRQTRKTMWILCLLPNFAILSSIFLRESIVTMFLTLSLYAFVRWIRGKREIYFIFAVALTFLGAYFHSGAIAVAVGYLVARVLIDKKSGAIHFSFGSAFASGLILLIGTLFLNVYGNSFLGKFAGVNELSDIAEESTMGGSSYAAYVGNSSSIGSMVVYSIPRIVFFLFSPMPWMIRGIGDIIAFLFSACFYILCMWNTIRYLRRQNQENRAIVFMIFIAAMAAVFVFAWGTSNAGTACRHRDKMVTMWAVLYALTPKSNTNRQNVSIGRR